jgi:DNA-binding transcriptional LysR family regulator
MPTTSIVPLTFPRIDGVVRLTASEAFSGFLVRHLAVLHDRYPDLMVEVLSGNRFFDLTRGEADVALRIGETTQPDLICKRIGRAGWSVYAAVTYLARRGLPASLDDLGGHAVIGFDETMSQVPGAVWLESHAGGAEVVLRGNSIVAVLNAAIVGMGIAVLPCFMAEAQPTLQRLSDGVIGSRDIWLVFHQDVGKIARVRTVIDFLAEVVDGELAVLRGDRPEGIEGLVSSDRTRLRLGSGALGMTYTAAGHLDGCWQRHVNSWDILAEIAIVTEAGSVTNDYSSAD